MPSNLIWAFCVVRAEEGQDLVARQLPAVGLGHPHDGPEPAARDGAGLAPLEDHGRVAAAISRPLVAMSELVDCASQTREPAVAVDQLLNGEHRWDHIQIF